jgi:acyl dehydratase
MSQGNTNPDLGIASRMVDAWARASSHLTNSALEANRATLAAFGLRDGSGSSTARAPDWTVERTVEDPADIAVGDTVTFSKRIEADDVDAFAYASGDTNRLHLEEEYAAETRFGERIAHGGLVSGLVSAALARLPGMVIYLSQDTRFLNPVTLDQRLTAVVEVVEALGNGRFRLSTVVTDEGGEEVIDGEAIVLVDDPPIEGESGVA